MILKEACWLRRRGALLTILACLSAGAAAAEEEVEEGWKGEVAAALGAQTGTVDTFSASTDASLERIWEKDTLTFRFTGVYGTSRDRGDSPSNTTTIQNAQVLVGIHRRNVTGRFFWATRSELSRDTTQNRDARVMLSTGPGYRIWGEPRSEKRFFDAVPGVGYRYELYDGNTGSTRSDNGYDRQLADVLAAFVYKNLFFDEKLEWSHSGSVFMPVNDTNAFIVRTEVIMGVPLTAAWSFRTTFLYEYTNDNATDTNKSLTRTSVGLGYSF